MIVSISDDNEDVVENLPSECDHYTFKIVVVEEDQDQQAVPNIIVNGMLRADVRSQKQMWRPLVIARKIVISCI